MSRCYRQDSLILETTFECEQGAVTVTDFMPVRDGASDLVRIVRGLKGEVSLRSDLTLRFDYGNVVPWVDRAADDTLRAVAGPHKVVLRSSVPHHGEALSTVSELKVAAGQTALFTLTYGPSHLADPIARDPAEALASTEQFWRRWTAGCTYEGAWRDAVVRSLITLKALTYAPTGGLCAAPTTSLPEQLGGQRNWDYYPVAFGSSTTCSCKVAAKRLSTFSNGCFLSATTLVCWRRNTTPYSGVSSAIFPRRFRTSLWSARP